MVESALTWWTFFKISVNERLVYRADFMLGTLMRFLPTLTQIFLWWAIYDVISSPASDDSAAGPDGRIAGFRYGDMVAYYLLVIIARAFSSMPGLTGGIAKQIRKRRGKKVLDSARRHARLFADATNRTQTGVLSDRDIAVRVGVFSCAEAFSSPGGRQPMCWSCFFLSLAFSFLLGFFLECCIGLIGFWFLEVTSLTFIYMLMNFLLSGHMFPLDLLPSEPVNIRGVVDFLPFKFLAYFPAAVFLGKIEGPEMYRGLLVEISWVVFFIMLSRFLWWKGIKRYSGFGG